MTWRRAVPRYLLAVAGAAVAICAGTVDWAVAAPQGQGGGPSATLFTLVDTNKDGAVSREELKGTFDKWYTEWDKAKTNALTLEQVFMGLGSVFPPAPPAGGRGGAPAQNQTPRAEDVSAMMAALPATAPAKPKQPRKVLVLGKGSGFRPLLDTSRGANDRRDRQEDRRLVDDHHLRRGRHQRRQSQAVRRHLPCEHHRRLPRRPGRCGGDRGAAQGTSRLRPRRQGPRRHSRRHRLLSPEFGASRRRSWRRDQLCRPAGGHADGRGRQEQ